jgi:hypothetical protein
MSTQAQAITFDFEEHEPTGFGAGGYTSLTSVREIPTSPFTGSDELSMTLQVVRVQSLNLTDENEAVHQGLTFHSESFPLRFDVAQWSSAPDSFDANFIDPYFHDPMSPHDDDVWMLMTFSAPLHSILVSITDQGVFTDTLRMLAFHSQDASGPLAAYVEGTFTSVGGSPEFTTLSLEPEDFFSEDPGTQFFQSILFRSQDRVVLRGDLMDNVTVELSEVPEPATGMMTGFTIGALAAAAGLLRRS